MAVQHLAVAPFGVGAEDGPIFLVKSPHHGPPRHIAQMNYLNQRERSISEILGHRDGGDSLLCRFLSLLGIPCGAALTCSAAAEAQKTLNTRTDIGPETRQILSNVLSGVVDICAYSSDFVTTLEVSGLPTSSNPNTQTFSPVPLPPTSVSPATSSTNTGASFPSSNPTGPSGPTPPSLPNQSPTDTASTSNGSHDASLSLSISGGSEGDNFNGSGASETGGLTPAAALASPTDSPSLPASPSPTTSSGSSLTSIAPNPSPEPPSSLSLAPGGLIPGASESPTPQDPHPHRHNVGAIIAIVLGVLALLLCIALAVLFFLRRRARARRRARRTSSGSPWQRLKPHVYGESSSRPESSIWTWFGSVPIDTKYEAPQEPRSYRYSPANSHLAEKDAGPVVYVGERLDAYSSHPSRCPSPAPAEARPLAGDTSVHSLHTSLPYLNAPVSSAGLEASSSSTELLALAGTDYAVANPFSDIHEVRVGRSVSGVSRTTASSGEVQSVEAL
ncbi:hypothetical protein V8D89_000972 [Ganoderma adspersum]